ncbi:glycoside hydrolase family 16 protein [Polyporus arcularius HHB13444]|uniref:Glycoside hydrolase family 16 protein n=1 Tax=Polyporus arcularius HHB13444 TaxID=1314778 RepID=A0A5C3PQX6_9APHY|nr:glycoside hydrolase family 16 protein [Polyporus arcularius HHB13444]
MRSTAALFTLSAVVSSALGATYPVKDSFVGQDFLTGFVHQAIADPTHGRVQYVDQATALAQNLTFASDTSFIMRADSFSVLDPAGPGRKAVRIKSNAAYSTHVTVFDIRHMPQGCGTWPAAWEVNEEAWPGQGEVDILEGTNDIEPNQSTLHTSANCAQPAVGRAMSGLPVTNNCDVAANGNAGCGVQATAPNSYGKSFNAAGGGFYAMERTTSFIKVWFWSRNDPAVPADVKTAGANVNTDAWGTPSALFVPDTCDIPSHFGAHNIIINLTFCGDWAGLPQFFNALGGCPGDCATFVNQNPSAFNDAFWDIAGVHVYA